MTVNLNEKTFDCVKFKESLYANMWKKSKASNLEEYNAWLKEETAKVMQERQRRTAQNG